MQECNNAAMHRQAAQKRGRGNARQQYKNAAMRQTISAFLHFCILH
jgi:hypothetical protein